MLRNIFYISGSILIFFAGTVIYGILLNMGDIPLNEVMKQKKIEEVKDVQIYINRRSYTLDLYLNNLKVKSYNAVFGKNNNLVKASKNDFITPIGHYTICDIEINSMYYKKLRLNYPNKRDAAEALQDEIINRNEYLKIMETLDKGLCPYESTKLGANISIHGIGEYNFVFKNLPFTFNWTNGSIALSNENIDELLSVVEIGTNVYIKN